MAKKKDIHEGYEAKKTWERMYRILPLYKNLQDAQRAVADYDNKSRMNGLPVPCYALLQIPNVMNGVLFHEGDIILYCGTDGRPSSGTEGIKVISTHMTLAIAERFAKSHYEAFERILLT